MKTGTRRLLIELASTAIASPVILLLLFWLRAYTVVAILAYPTLPLLRAVSGWVHIHYPSQGGGWFPGLGEAMLAEVFILPVWTWLLLMFLVRLFARSKRMREQ